DIDNAGFGQSNILTRYDDRILHGFGVRPYFWDTSTEVQQQLSSTMSITAGYYRNSFGNFTVTNNLFVTPADYNQFCVTAPTDARLPGGGNYQTCGLYDVAPTLFGRVNNLVVPASDFGKQTLVNDFFNITVNGRHGS